MTSTIARHMALFAVLLILGQITGNAQVSVPQATCRTGVWECDLPKPHDVMRFPLVSPSRKQALDACRARNTNCDALVLTPAEASALALANHDNNLSICMDASGKCDHGLLTERNMERSRSLSACKTDRIAWRVGHHVIYLFSAEPTCVRRITPERNVMFPTAQTGWSRATARG